jgi:hypothetical protein
VHVGQALGLAAAALTYAVQKLQQIRRQVVRVYRLVVCGSGPVALGATSDCGPICGPV